MKKNNCVSCQLRCNNCDIYEDYICLRAIMDQTKEYDSLFDEISFEIGLVSDEGEEEEI